MSIVLRCPRSNSRSVIEKLIWCNFFYSPAHKNRQIRPILSGGVWLSGGQAIGLLSTFRAACISSLFHHHSLRFLLFPCSVALWWLSRRTELSATVALTPVSIQSCSILSYVIPSDIQPVWCRPDLLRFYGVAGKYLWCLLSCFAGFFSETARKGTVVSRANSIGSTSASSVPNTGNVFITEGSGKLLQFYINYWN